VLCGDEAVVRERFGPYGQVETSRQTLTFDFPFGPAEVVDQSLQHVGPMKVSFSRLDPTGQKALAEELAANWARHNEGDDHHTIVKSQYFDVMFGRDDSQPQLEAPRRHSMAPTTDNGIINQPSTHSVDATVEKLKGILQAKGVTLFALVDHSGEAEKVGMKMRPTKLLIFGSPKAGTPLMLAAPSIAIDLPLKILVWEDSAGKVWASYNSSAYLQQRHGLPQDLLQNIAVLETLAAKAGE
jgi:uncharacterized protein (DUF302 family)